MNEAHPDYPRWLREQARITDAARRFRLARERGDRVEMDAAICELDEADRELKEIEGLLRLESD